jgi:hypothetical protein
VSHMNPHWSEGRLWVNGDLENDPQCLQKVANVIMFMMK